MRIGFVLFPNVTQLDFTGPAEVFAFARYEVVYPAASMDPVPTSAGFSVLPTHTFETCPPLDVVCVPGGSGQDEAMVDAATLEFVRKAAAEAKYVTSVCTGSLVLAAAGLLRGYRATTHWMALDFLGELGAIPVKERVVVDRNRVTGAGVSSGIDFALSLVGIENGPDVARRVMRGIEYDPVPPYAVDPADDDVLRSQSGARLAKRGAAVAQAAAALGR
ncbi:isonitrile hydratase-like protein [Dipodascopsis tothii]|uniref:isonitrile hydratase-like protein n=1 Tax=Dipodascopsis tothii TaxID=44089 RepID=UPI0034CEB908